MVNDISIIIHTRNVQSGILDCIQSAQLITENIILIDMESTDDTVKIAKGIGARIYYFPYSQIVEPARAFGISKSQTDWIFLLDADERLTEELAEEIKNAIKSETYSYYKVPRKEIVFHKKWLQHGGWWPNYQIRLINKRYFESWPQKIHSTPVIKGEFTFLNSPLLHYSQNDLSEIVSRTVIFEDKESDLLLIADKTVNTPIFFRKFFGELYRRLIKGFGFLDGEVGIIESIYQAFSKTITYLYLYEKSRSL